jgi:hypothetical protein
MSEAPSTQKFFARVCAHCGKPKGTVCFRMVKNGKPFREYYHPKCAAIVKGKLDHDKSA